MVPRMRSGPGRLVLYLAMAALGGGCVVVEGEVAGDGSATFRYTYGPPRHATFASERSRLGSPHVRVEAIEPGREVTATLSTDDVTRLDTADAFRDVRVEFTHENGSGQLMLSLPGFDDDMRRDVLAAADSAEKRALRLSLLLPGEVREARPRATVDGRRAAWSISLLDWARAGDRIEVSVAWGSVAPDTPPHSM